MTPSGDDCGNNTIAVAQDPGLDQSLCGGEMIHGGGLAGGGLTSTNTSSENNRLQLCFGESWRRIIWEDSTLAGVKKIISTNNKL